MTGHRRRLLAGAALTLAASCAELAPPAPYVERWWQASPPPTMTATPTAAPGAVTPRATPTERGCAIEVFDVEPARPFDLVAIVEVEPRAAAAPGSLLDAAKLQACNLGGDALVVLYRAEERSGFARVPPAEPGFLPAPDLRVAVIRWRAR